MIVTIEYPDDETVAVLVDGSEVMTANHDEHGWAGVDAVRDTAVRLCRALGVPVKAEEI